MMATGDEQERGRFVRFDHLKFWVGNAKQAASYYECKFGFEPFAYRGLETGSRKVATHVVRQNDIVFAFESPYEPYDQTIGAHLLKHGDAVKDVALEVEDLESVVGRAEERGAEIVRNVWEESDEFGTVRMATIRTFGDTTHTLIDRKDYRGFFLPGYERLNADEDRARLPAVNLDFIDHVVGNQPDGQMEPVVGFYERVFSFHRFWSIDDSLLHTEYSASNTVIVANREETIKIPILEPAPGKRKSQIAEYVEYNGGAGVQHVAMNTSDIVGTVRKLRSRGTEFLHVPDAYYDDLRRRLEKSRVKIAEDLNDLQRLKILVDFDEVGYLLQIFTKTPQDRPTVFFEVIQRHNHQGFGAGNVKALYESVELEQRLRGNL